MRFKVLLIPEKNGYFVKLPQLDVSSQGDTMEEALENIKDALLTWLDNHDLSYEDIEPNAIIRELDIDLSDNYELEKKRAV